MNDLLSELESQYNSHLINGDYLLVYDDCMNLLKNIQVGGG